MSDKNLAMIVIAATFMLAACSPSEPEAPAAAAPEPAEPAPAPAEAPAEPAPMSLADLLASDLRSEEDRARDPGRKPVDVLNFFGVEAGMDVVDLMAAGGWPRPAVLLWIVLACIFARSAAMSFNRLHDYRFDRLNPRTRNWPLVSGRLSRGFLTTFCVACSTMGRKRSVSEAVVLSRRYVVAA